MGKKLTNDRIKELKSQIASNSKDHKWCEKQLSELLSLHKELMQEPVELIVPAKEVTQQVDFGSWSLKRTIRGILFEAKGGMSTFVETRMQSAYGMLSQVFDLHENPSEDEEQKKVEDMIVDAIAYTMQCPLFSSINVPSLLDNATSILTNFNKYVSENVDNDNLKDETEDDVKEFYEAEKQREFFEGLADSQLPTADE